MALMKQSLILSAYASLYVMAYNIELESKYKEKLGNYKIYPNKEGRYTYFIKCIHLMGNKGVFAFYTGINPNLVLNFKEYNQNGGNSELTDFISEVVLEKKSFNTDCLLNDLIKIKDNKICFISTSENNDKMYIVLLTLFYSNSYKIAIRYYTINISVYNFKFYKTIRAYLYNNFISLGFSYCKASSCSSDNTLHFSSFMFLNYPNGTDYNLDLLDEMITKNEIIDNYEINLHNQVLIDNNIFGLVYSIITIKKYSNCSPLIFRSSLNEKVNIIEDYNLGEEENIIVKNIPTQKLKCSIAYSYTVTEPSFDVYSSYPDIEVFPDNSYTESFFSDETDYYESRLIFYNISINEELSNACDNKNCLLCLSNNKMDCIICNNSFSINYDNNGKYKICGTDAEQTSATTYNKNEKTSLPTTNKEKDEETPKVKTYKTEESTNIQKQEKTNTLYEENTSDIIEEKITYKTLEKDYFSTEFIIEKTDSFNCTKDGIINNECEKGLLTSEQMKEVYQYLKDYYVDNFNGESNIINTENVIFQVSTFEYQKNMGETNISSIDLGKCEERLKRNYNISDNDSLIILKIDTKSEDHKQTYVQYEVFSSNHEPLNLSYCNDLQISIFTPVNLEENTIQLYKSLKQSGYNIFDSNDAFYNDICSKYSTDDGKDMLLEDRKKSIYSTSGNISMCQDGCTFESYNSTTKKSVCNCNVQTEPSSTDLNNLKFSPKELGKKFMKTITNSNFRVLKCYQLAIDTKNIFENIGRVIMTVIFLFYLFSLFFYIIKERKKIDMFIISILKNKENNVKSDLDVKEASKAKNISYKENKENKKEKDKSKKKSKSKFFKGKKNFPPKKRNFNNNKAKSEYNNSSTRSITVKTVSPLKSKKININIHPTGNIKYIDSKKNEKFILKSIEKKRALETDSNKQIKNNLEQIENLNDQELNSLNYKIAVYVDKRTYFQYYWSLLKKKHLILFTILPANDYNLYSLKLALFLLSFSLYFTINGFFFSDSTMHKINEGGGIIFQIPQILYSSIISAVINMILKILSLSEKDILLLKQENNIKKFKRDSIHIKKCIIFKFIIFFVISNLLLLFFWYFISCFCAVYKNTQIILLKDTMISFALSMLYPLGLNLLPGFFRIPALKDKKMKSEYMYKLSGYIAII